MADYDFTRAGDLCATFTDDPDVVAAWVSSPNGTVIAQYVRNDDPILIAAFNESGHDHSVPITPAVIGDIAVTSTALFTVHAPARSEEVGHLGEVTVVASRHHIQQAVMATTEEFQALNRALANGVSHQLAELSGTLSQLNAHVDAGFVAARDGVANALTDMQTNSAAEIANAERNAQAHSDNIAAAGVRWAMGIGIGSAAVALVCFWLVARSITRPLIEASLRLRASAQHVATYIRPCRAYLCRTGRRCRYHCSQPRNNLGSTRTDFRPSTQQY